MNRLTYAILFLLALTSCVNSYNIQGTSNVSSLDGRMLYLKVLKNNDFRNIDSCEVVHGQFHFAGTYDTIHMANIFMDEESILPLVLEDGEISIRMDNTQQNVSGTPLNDELFKFFSQYNQLKGRQADLVHQHDQAIMEGQDMAVVNRALQEEASRISQEEDQLITSFVTDNFDNVLGPGVFFMMTIGYQYPELTPWIEYIMSKATDKFKSDPYVKDYYEKAQENQAIMNGMKEVPVASVPQQQGSVPPAPTPNQLAAPAE